MFAHLLRFWLALTSLFSIARHAVAKLLCTLSACSWLAFGKHRAGLQRAIAQQSLGICCTLWAHLPSLLQALAEHLPSKSQTFYQRVGMQPPRILCAFGKPGQAFCVRAAGYGQVFFLVLFACPRQAFCKPLANTCLFVPFRASFSRGRRKAKKLVHFSICACHPCAGAMLIFSVSFQF